MCPAQDSETADWFAAEIQPHEPELRRYLSGIAARDAIDDLVQETYARLLKARLARPIRAPRGLLFAIARNAARDIFRKKHGATVKVIEGLEDFDVIDGATPNPSDSLLLTQETAILKAAIESLPERCRQVFVLRKLQHKSHQEIATEMGITVHTVEVQLINALRRCDRFFAQHSDMPGKVRKA